MENGDHTTKVDWTSARALLVRLMELYRIPDYRLSLLEVQKLAYFLQVAGEPLRLRFVKHIYGPYADNLNHVLQVMEGHFIRGYGDRSRDAEIRLVDGAAHAAAKVLEGHAEAQDRLDRVRRLIEGFETPYGMELLATVHWVAREDPTATGDPERAIEAVAGWSEGKNARLRPEHIRSAWQRLDAHGWLSDLEPPSATRSADAPP